METAAWISALVALAAFILAEYRRRTAKRESERTMQEVGDKQREAAGVNYGWSAQAMTSSLLVLNEQGNSLVARDFDGIRANRDVQSITSRSWLTTPGGKVTGEPRFHGPPSFFPKAVTCTPQVHVSDGVYECEYTVMITNCLTPQDPPLNFRTEVDYEQGVLMRLENVKRAYAKDPFKWDYHSVRIEYPIERLTIAVEFAEDWGFKTFAGVFYGRERHHELEFQRVRRGFTRGRKSTFDIEEPKVGFEYLIYWVVPK